MCAAPAKVGHQEIAVFPGDAPKVRKVGLDRPWAWLGAGWNDIRTAPRVSLLYGLVFAIAGMIILGLLVYFEFYSGVLPAFTGFMLIAPVLVVGLYEVSREIGRGRPVGAGTPMQAWRHGGGQIGFMGFVLLLFFLAWIRFATLLFAIFFGSNPPNLATFVTDVVISGANIPFLLVGTAIGAVLAVLVFAISAISIPMLVDRRTNVLTAMATSFVAVRSNPVTMGVWGFLIVCFVAAGMLLGFIGLAVTLPLIAHGTWHAYKDIVVDGAGPPLRGEAPDSE